MKQSGIPRIHSGEEVKEEKCPVCQTPLEEGFVSTSNGSGLYWSHDHPSARLRPNGLEVLAPTGFMGTFSANLSGRFCRSCRTIELRLAARPT